ncbi:MAG TPA: hypothetical protein VL832_03135 [Puia sp.]|nr:hypothetical protein [Puia sp.]
MSTDEFQIEFNYQEIPYIGIVTPVAQDGATWYRVNLESENQEEFVEILVKPSTSTTEDWDFECEPSGNALDYYDKGLLEEVGEAIEKYNTAELDKQ